jgi:NAD-reducing hydrogenase large subunit
MTQSSKSELKRVVIEPVTRVEGHGKVTILLDDAGQVEQARLHIVEFRGFERFIQGRPYWEMPVAVQRLCGICPVSHHLCAAKAVDRVVGVDQLTPTAEKVRRLMHYGQFFQSHALHFFYLAAPDLLFGFGADVAKRNVIEVARQHPELAKQGILMRKWGQEIIRITSGKRIHGTGAVPGGVNKNVSISERDELLAELDQMIAWSQDAVNIARDVTLKDLPKLGTFGAFPSSHLSIVRGDGAMDLYDGDLRAIDSEGATIFEGVDDQSYHEVLAEDVRPWSYMKFPFIRERGPADGWYRVGPLSRMETCSHIDTPLAEAARQEYKAALGAKPVTATMAYHWARMIETLHASEVIGRLLEDPDLQGDDLLLTGERRRTGIGVVEAPRGTLFHHYEVGDDDLVKMCNLIVSTTSNNEAMNRAVTGVAQEYISGQEITEGLLNHVEVAIRAYDPCLSCATHAVGQMPLIVDLVDPDGNVVDHRVRDGR